MRPVYSLFLKLQNLQKQMNLLHDSGPSCINSFGPSWLQTHRLTMQTHQPTVGQSFGKQSTSSPPHLPADGVFILTLQFNSFNTWPSFSCCPATCTHPLTVNIEHGNFSQFKKKKRKPGSTPPYVPCSNLPSALSPLSPPCHLPLLKVCLCQQNFRPWFLRINFAAV